MISTDFASNESWDDAVLSLKLLLRPWKWRKGKEIKEVKKVLLAKLAIQQPADASKYNDISISLFLSGRSALYFLLKSLNLAKGTGVLVQAFTCEAVVLPIIELGLKPVYIDIESETYSMDYDRLTSKLGNKVTVLILQHTFGLAPKFREKIIEFANKRKIVVIEDLAHGFSNNLTIGQYNNCYTLLSFGRSKMLSSVFGGAVVSVNSESMKQLDNETMNLEIPSYSFIFLCLLYKPLTMFIKSTYDFYLGKILHKIFTSFGLLIPEVNAKEKKGKYDHLYNKAYPNALAILLLHQLKKFDQTGQRRSLNCNFYNQQLKKFTKTGLPAKNQGLIRYPLQIENRDSVWSKAASHNVYLGLWYDQVISPKGLDLAGVEYKRGSCPAAEEVCKKIINLPTNISEKEAEKVINTLSEVEQND